MKLRGLLLTLALIAAFSFSGCYLRPDLGSPGTIGMQRGRAALHDPFPDNNLGPPIMGGRPLGFEQPRAEVRRDQENPNAQRGRAAQPYNGF